MNECGDSKAAMNGTDTATFDISALEFWIHIVVFYGILGGICSTVGNTCMAVAIAGNKNLRTRFFVILGFLLAARAITDFELFVIFVHRTLRTLNLVPTNIKRFYCFTIHFHLYYSLTVEMILLLGLVIDRALAILAYYYYRTLTYRQAIVACAVAVSSVTALKMIPSFFVENFTDVIPCVNGYSPFTRGIVSYHQNSDLGFGVLILALYVSLLLYVRFRFVPYLESARDRTGDTSAVDAFKRQARLLPVLRRLVLIHCGLTLLAKVFMSASNFVPNEVGLRLVAYGGMLLTVDHFSTVVMLLISNRDLRRATSLCFTNEVTPVQMPTNAVGRKAITQRLVRPAAAEQLAENVTD